MAHNKKQHFVPQLLQRCFSLDQKSIGMYLIDSNECVSASISNTAQKRDYYKINDTDKISIEQVYGNIETNANPIIKKLQKIEFDLESEEMDILFLFVVAQLMRTPKAANAMGAVLDICMKRGILEIKNEVDSGIRNHENLPMQASLVIPRVAVLLSGKSYLFVCNNTNTRFLLSDNPACLFSPVANIAIEKDVWDRMSVQEPFSGYMLYMPLGPSVGIICFDDDYYNLGPDMCMNATESDVKMLNALEIINASEFVMFQKGTFDPDTIKDALAARYSDEARRLQGSIYTPIDNTFSLSALHLDSNSLMYLINRYAIEKHVDKPRIRI